MYVLQRVSGVRLIYLFIICIAEWGFYTHDKHLNSTTIYRYNTRIYY